MLSYSSLLQLLCVLFAAIFPDINSTVVWRNYTGLVVDILTCSYDIEYELSFADCQQRCTDAASDETRCKGVLYFDRLRLDVPNDPTRCYLLHKICALTLWEASSAMTAFWYEDLTSATTSISSSALSGITCINYPSTWADSFGDTCAQYEAGGFCDGADVDATKSHLLSSATNGLNAFQTCCDCAGSIHQTSIGLFEPTWKSSEDDSIDVNIACQTYTPLQVDASEIHSALPQKWTITDFFSVCKFDTAKLSEKYNILYFLSDSTSTSDADFELLQNYQCLDDILDGTHAVTVNVCDTFDYAVYPYLIDVSSMSSSNSTVNVYVNGLFFDANDFMENVNAPHITVQRSAECHIASLLESNAQSNLVSTFLCEQQTLPPTSTPTLQPTAEPTSEPTQVPVSGPTAAVNGDLRLVDGAYEIGDPIYEGRVEIFYNGTWGTICDDSFDGTDAQVICRQLGYHTVIEYDYSAESTATGQIWLDNLACTGDEWRLEECGHNGWGDHNCQHSEDVHIRCSSDPTTQAPSQPTSLPTVSPTGLYDLRLADGICSSTLCEGRVEVFYEGEWGTICDDTANADALGQVICRQLGYSTVVEFDYSATSNTATGQIWLDDVLCGGSELQIDQCSHSGFGTHNCGHSEDIHIRCADASGVTPTSVTPTVVTPTPSPSVVTIPTDLRLVDGAYLNGDPIYEGRVEVFYNGEWGTVCDDTGTANADALGQVICRQLGYETVLDFDYSSDSSASGQIWLDDLACTGSESRLQDCEHAGWGDENCGHDEDVYIRCGDPLLSDGRLRLVGGSCGAGVCDGRVEIFYNGTWGTICDDGTDQDTEGSVICRQLGFDKVLDFDYSSDSATENPIWLDSLECSGEEVALVECSHAGWGVQNCGHSEDIYIRCGGSSRTTWGAVTAAVLLVAYLSLV